MLLDYIRNFLAQAAGALDVYPLYMVVDRASIHNAEKILEVFHDWGCQELKGGGADANCSSQASFTVR